MFANDTSNIIRCGFGGCKAPERPLSIKAPGVGNETLERSGDSSSEDAVGVVIYAGFGGCRAPKKPMPMVLSGASGKSERMAA